MTQPDVSANELRIAADILTRARKVLPWAWEPALLDEIANEMERNEKRYARRAEVVDRIAHDLSDMEFPRRGSQKPLPEHWRKAGMLVDKYPILLAPMDQSTDE